MNTKLLEELKQKVSNPYELTTILSKRIKELSMGSPRLVDVESNNLAEIAYHEILEDKISLVDKSEARETANEEEVIEIPKPLGQQKKEEAED